MKVILSDDRNQDIAQLNELFLRHGVKLHGATVQRIYTSLKHLSDMPPEACFDAPPKDWGF